MGFKKGATKPNTSGRQKGAKNKRTVALLGQIEKVMSLLDTTIEEDIAALKPIERANMWKDLQEYMRPKLQRTELKSADEGGLVIKIIHE